MFLNILLYCKELVITYSKFISINKYCINTKLNYLTTDPCFSVFINFIGRMKLKTTYFGVGLWRLFYLDLFTQNYVLKGLLKTDKNGRYRLYDEETLDILP